MPVPAFLLKRLYVRGSLRATADGFEFAIHNKLASGLAHEMRPVTLDGESLPLEQAYFRRRGEPEVRFSEVSEARPFALEAGSELLIGVRGVTLAPGPHTVGMGFVVPGFGALAFEVTDTAS